MPPAASHQPVEPKGTESTRHIPAQIRDKVYARDKGRCTYVARDGTRCGSTYGLHIDHILPFARGGKSTPENLRLLCARHNQAEAERVFGRAYVERYSRNE
jgi:5-methylcytosine-specific restriction endonuclease McrA